MNPHAPLWIWMHNFVFVLSRREQCNHNTPSWRAEAPRRSPANNPPRVERGIRNTRVSLEGGRVGGRGEEGGRRECGGRAGGKGGGLSLRGTPPPLFLPLQKAYSRSSPLVLSFTLITHTKLPTRTSSWSRCASEEGVDEGETDGVFGMLKGTCLGAPLEDAETFRRGHSEGTFRGDIQKGLSEGFQK